MSRADEQVRYIESRKAPSHPRQTLGWKRHITVDNFRYHEIGRSADGVTRSYRVTYEQKVWSQTTKESEQTWTATVDFQWHPELPMPPADRDINRGGFQVIAYSTAQNGPGTTS